MTPSRARHRAARRASRGAGAARAPPERRPGPRRPPASRPSPPCPRPWVASLASSLAPLGLRHRLLPPGYRLALAAARARVRARALTANRQVAPVTKTAVAADLLKALDVERDLAAQITFD